MKSPENTKELISTIIERIVKGYRPQKIILFGSHAYGNPNPDSDIDLLIIKETDKRPIDRWVEVKRLLRGSAGTTSVEPYVYTEKEIEERKAIRDFFVEDILENGKVLHE